MSALPYPRGDARAIAEARAGGQRPAQVVLIILAGRFENDSNPKVYAQAGQQYRWDWLRGLNAVVLVDASTRLGNILQDIERSEPAQIDVVDFERGKGWLVLGTKPGLSTVRWPRLQVADWLGTGEWHQELNQLKTRANQKAVTQQAQTPTFEPEAIWN